jgi:hypothetical protein
MSWHRVTISGDLAAEGFVNAISLAVQATSSAESMNKAEVYRDGNIGTGYTFYLSPRASIIASNVLEEFSAVACAKPDLTELHTVLPGR